jgi:uncharacterized integral membrane protein
MHRTASPFPFCFAFPRRLSYRPANVSVMNAKLILKTLFLMLVLLLLVLMGMHNKGVVNFALPPLLKGVSQPAAIMYFAFFAVGMLTGTLLTSGGGKRGSSGSSSKSSAK